MERFKSVLVEDAAALQTMAAYIDLNPVRAGICDDPAEYQWCGYAEAEGGSKRAKAGLCKLMNVAMDSWDKHAFLYRSFLFNKGSERIHQDGTIQHKGVDSAELERPINQHLTSLLHYRKQLKSDSKKAINLLQKWKQFSSGLVLGSRKFVQQFRE